MWLGLLSVAGYIAAVALPRPALYFGYAAVLVAIGVIDYRERRIPNAITYPAIAFALGATLNSPGPEATLAAGGATALLFLLPVLIYGPQRAGIGDVKLGLFVGLILGPTLALFWSLFVAFGLAAVVGLAGLLAGRLRWQSTFPFGPYLACGALVGLWLASF
jgi:leader peptidase (prepilin peptidase)/N-methyltransferase